MKYKIYHINNVKIGCSVNPARRVKTQGYTEYEILEEHDDINVASKREIELQIQYGYKIDNVEYYKTINTPTIESRKLGGQIAGKLNGIKQRDEGKLKNFQIAGGLKQGPITGKKNRESGHISNLGKKMTQYNNREQICPHCGIESRGVGFSRWHGENCKKKIT